MQAQFLDCDMVVTSSRKGLVYNAVYFQLPTSYKNDNRYTNGILKLSEFLSRTNKQFILRIWCDSHRFEQMTSLIQNQPQYKNVELLKYDCPSFKADGFHKQLFGSVIRFIAMSSQRDCFIGDVDFDTLVRMGFMHVYKARNVIVRDGIKVDYMYNGFNYLIAPAPRELSVDGPRFGDANNETLVPAIYMHPFIIRDRIMKTQTNKIYIHDKQATFPYIMAGFMYCNRLVPSSLLADFLTKTKREQRMNKAYAQDPVLLQRMTGEFPFGLDEQYLNHFLLPYMIKENFAIGIVQYYSISYTLMYYSDLIATNAITQALVVNAYRELSQYKSTNERLLRLLQMKLNHTDSIVTKDRFYKGYTPEQLSVVKFITLSQALVIDMTTYTGDIVADYRELYTLCSSYAYKVIQQLVDVEGVDAKFLRWQLDSRLIYAHYLMVTKGSRVNKIVTITELNLK